MFRLGVITFLFFPGVSTAFKGPDFQKASSSGQLDRRAAIRAAVGAFVAVTVPLGAATTAAVMPPNEPVTVISNPSSTLPNRTPFEMQYEMFKNGMQLEEDAEWLAAEQQWSEIIEEFETPAWREGSNANKYLLARAHANRGAARASMGRQREAILDYSAAVSLAPDKCEFWLSRGCAYEGMADEKIALEDCSPSRVRAFYESALSDYDHALVLNPTEPQVYIMRGSVLAVLEQHQDALNTYRKALQLKPSEPALRGRCALAEVQTGNMANAQLLVGSVLRQSGEGSPDMLLLGAALSWDAGELAEAEVMYKMATSLDRRLLDDRYITYGLRWPAIPLHMVKMLRISGGVTDRLGAVHTLIGESI